ncbi:MAG: chemotaxis protein CheA [Methylobacter sp.]|nr:chemotaxis protein CheA [Methylobacter sp.]
MSPLLEQFISEAREFLQEITQKLMQLEEHPDSKAIMNELFRLVHTLKGNSGLFEFPEMTRVLHAGEDLLDAVRDSRVLYSQELTDRLLDAMDFVNLQVDEVQEMGVTGAGHAQNAVRLAESLRQLIATQTGSDAEGDEAQTPSTAAKDMPDLSALITLPEQQRIELYRSALQGVDLLFVEYTPEPECFFKGEDPFLQVRQIPQIIWQSVQPFEPWLALSELDPYRCNLVFRVLTTAAPEELTELFRYIPEQVRIVSVPAIVMALPQGSTDGATISDEFINDALVFLEVEDFSSLKSAAEDVLAETAPSPWLCSALNWLLLVLELESSNRLAQHALIASLRSLTAPIWQALLASDANVKEADIPAETVVNVAFTDDEADAFETILQAQRQILAQPDTDLWLAGRLTGVAATLAASHYKMGFTDNLLELPAALAESLKSLSAASLLSWLVNQASQQNKAEPLVGSALEAALTVVNDLQTSAQSGRRAEDALGGAKTLKVDQEKIDLLMGLIGEMVVAKNSLPYLAVKAETHYGMRELSREIKSQYAVINRIAEEMQDAIMQVRMMPVSFIFQRFPRLVRDTSRKLGKDVNLVLEGEDTEIDKNIVEALADPLIHIVRNSLDHGIEMPEVRKAQGKSEIGKLTIRATQEADRVYIDIFDDGKGMDPKVIKMKAYEKGIIDEATLERLSDQEALNLIFAAGFSTAEVISDLSGRGVGMDVVRNAVEKVNGTVSLDSEIGKGTRIRLSLPLSMAVTNVMVVETDDQIFGIPMDMVVETVRVPRAAIHTIKTRQTTVLRNRIVPLFALNNLLALNASPRTNADDMFATLVVRINDEHIGILVDEFRETIDIILKPMVGIIGGLGGYAGSALLGDGSVLMVLNPKELV